MPRLIDTPQSRCRFALARQDITPPVGAYHRLWGAATHEVSTAVHRPCLCAVLLFQPEHSADTLPQVLVSVDLCFIGQDVLDDIAPRIAEQTGLPRENFIFSPSHTHSTGYLDYTREQLPGGNLIRPYFAHLANVVIELTRQARSQLQPAVVTYGTGQCQLAAHRDFWDRETKQYVCGFSPDGPVDTRVVVARVTDAAGVTLATLANYACHPTTLGWRSSLISPDYIGAMREVVERETNAPCLFMQGAAGDIGPREGYVADPAVADRNGRQLGFAVLEAVTGLPPAGTRFAYQGPVVSGATLGTWDYVPLPYEIRQQQAVWSVRDLVVPLPYRPELPQKHQLEQDRQQHAAEEQAALAQGDAAAARDRHALVERIDRQLGRLRFLPPGTHFPFPVRIWKLGDAVWVFLESEHYNLLQRALRARFPETPILINSLVNGPRCIYLPTEAYYNTGVYQETIAVLAAGALESLTQTIGDEIARLLLSE